MISDFFHDNEFALAVVTTSVLSASFMLSLQPTYAVQSGSESPQLIAPSGKLTYTSLGDLRGSIEGLLSDLSDIARSTGEQLSGKIASSKINLNNGTVEKVLFGNWSLDSQQGNRPVLFVNFEVLSNSKEIPLRQAAAENFTISNLTINSMQQNDGNTEIGGTVNVIKQLGNQQQQMWDGVGARLILANNVLVLTLDQNSEPGKIFVQSPIVGFITQPT